MCNGQRYVFIYSSLLLRFSACSVFILAASLSAQEEAPVANAAPVVAVGANAQIVRGGTFSRSGSFTDPDSTAWMATVDYGDGSGVQPLNLNGTTFELNRVYASYGLFYVTVTVTDDGGESGEDWLLVVVDDVYEDNDTLATAAVLNLPANEEWHAFADLYCRDDDWYKITVPSGKNLIEVKLDFAHGYASYDLDLYLKNATGTTLAKSESGGAGEFLRAVVAPGDYFIQVTGWGGATNTYSAFVLIGTSADVILPDMLAVELPNAADVSIRGDAEPLASLLTAEVAALNPTYSITHNRMAYDFPIGWTPVTWYAHDLFGNYVGLKTARVYVFRHGQTPIGISKNGTNLSQYGDTAYSGAANHGANVARDGNGLIHVAWLERTDAGVFRIVYRRGIQSANTGKVIWLTPLQDISGGAAYGRSFVALAVTAGAVHFTWTSNSSGKIQYRRLKRDGDEWTLEPLRDTGTTGPSGDNSPDFAAYSDDEIHIVSRSLIYAYTLNGGGVWSPAQDLWADSFTKAPGATSCKYPAVTVDSLGRVHVVYTAVIRSNYWQVWYLRRERPLPDNPGAWVESVNSLAAFPQWGDPGASSSSNILADWLDIEADAANNLHIGWHGTALTGSFGCDDSFYMRRPAFGEGYVAWEQPLALHREQNNRQYSWCPSIGTDEDSNLAVPVFFYKALSVGDHNNYTDLDSAMRIVYNGAFADDGLLNGDGLIPLSQAAANMSISTWWPTTARRIYRHSNGNAWLDVFQCMKTKDGSEWTYLIHQRYELTGVLPPERVKNPDPPHQAVNVPNNKILSWDAANLAVAYDVYFGTSKAAVAEATTDSPEYKGRITAISHNPGALTVPQTYYWRIDSINGRGVTKGSLWRFQTDANTAPEIFSRFPDWSPVWIRSGEWQTFTVIAGDADDHELTYAWTINGKTVKSGTDNFLVWPSGLGGEYALRVNVGDGSASVFHEWTVIANDPPTAGNQTVYIAPNIPADVVLIAGDAQNNFLTYEISQHPAAGMLTGSAPTLVYSPNPGFEGVDSFKFRVFDGW